MAAIAGIGLITLIFGVIARSTSMREVPLAAAADVARDHNQALPKLPSRYQPSEEIEARLRRNGAVIQVRGPVPVR